MAAEPAKLQQKQDILETKGYKQRTNLVRNIIVYVLLGLIAILMMIPFVWMVSSSLKFDNQVFEVPIRWLPTNPQWANYKTIWTQVPMATFFKNTVILSVVITFIQLVTSSFAAYGFSRMRFRGRDTLFLFYIGTIAVPWQAYMIPQFIMMRQLHLTDNLLSLILLQSFSAFGVFLMRQYYEGIPEELSESARIDGLNEYGIYARIILPLTRPAIASLTILTFVNTWNDYMGPFIYLSSTQNKTIQLGLKMFVSLYDAQYALIMAASVLSILPVAVVFLTQQKYFVEGIATSGLKG
ncbi:carbohydrate ABC transporter permease [Schleiferilactobacillus harbinensis]|jgi:multiple sugar transport system permease protein|uniref:carbohydrate ABC transporter permease n=1 Tax=Schleiferilactobacillus harbinensis TaxID=304207 RepID=UPI001AB0182B|nr:carbohydrate ABC transporter permease [Schleiferilactobacillus harbinensis]